MGALKISTFIRPVGEPIRLKTGGGDLRYAGYKKEFYGSGTMALQAALGIAKALKPDIKQPNCLIAGYGCPDLITACIGAGIEPNIIDTSPDSPFPALEEIKEANSDSCIAIILVNFLGFSPPKELVNACRAFDLFIVEDRAQAFLLPSDSQQLFGDAAIFSFGKGKPLSLLGGGLLLVQNNTPFQVVSDAAQNSTISKLRTIAKIFVYNLLIKPRLYPLLLKLPGLSIGETRYSAPSPLLAMDDLRLSLLRANIAKYKQPNKMTTLSICERLSKVFKLLGCKVVLNGEEHPDLLRIPVLAHNTEYRDQLVTALCEAGIGATKLYQTTLLDISGLPHLERKARPLKNARNFASRLFTIPCHSGVTEQTISTIIATIESQLISKDAR